MSLNSIYMVNRRTFLKSAAATSLLGATGLSGCIGNFGEQPYVDGKIKMLMSPTEPQEQMRAQYTPIKERFESYVDEIDTAELKYAANYSATLEALNSGTADVAETGPFAAALGVNSEKGDIILQRHAYGTWTYWSVILTRADSDISKPSDLKGKKVAFGDTLSASGSLYPLYMLQQAGLSIPETPGSPKGADFEPTWSTHSTAFEAMMNGQADACGVGRFIAWDYGASDYVEGVKEVDIRSDIPRAPILVSPKLSDDEQTTITKAFTEAPDSFYFGEDGKKDDTESKADDPDDDIWFDGVRKADNSVYQPVVDVANALGYGQDIFEE